MKQTEMLLVSLRGINFGFWSRLGCSRQIANILSCQVPFTFYGNQKFWFTYMNITYLNTLISRVILKQIKRKFYKCTRILYV